MAVNYDHKANLHTLKGPRVALSLIFDGNFPHSVLDIGCGLGTWLNAFKEFGVQDYYGVDGADIAEKDLLIERDRFQVVDFSKPWTLGRKFDLVICLEVAEHLPPTLSQKFIEALCEHSDHILFSAACPNQPGQNHINCEWPEFWQNLFNKIGFACEDNVRPKIWNAEGIEVWYRQNTFTARRSPDAGKEIRIPGMVQPAFLAQFISAAAKAASERTRNEIVSGGLRFADYPKMAARAVLNRLMHR